MIKTGKEMETFSRDMKAMKKEPRGPPKIEKLLYLNFKSYWIKLTSGWIYKKNIVGLKTSWMEASSLKHRKKLLGKKKKKPPWPLGTVSSSQHTCNSSTGKRRVRPVQKNIYDGLKE